MRARRVQNLKGRCVAVANLGSAKVPDVARVRFEDFERDITVVCGM